MSERSSPTNEELVEQTYFCPHYKRKCKFVTPCCGGVYRCRFCHDEEQRHTLKREDVTTVECSQCGERQGVTEFCKKCKLKFGKYFCYECKLYDDEDKQQFHCSGCGICRVGGRNNYFHCHRCDMCLPNHLQGAHKCVEKVSRSNCPVCQEDIHTSRIPSQIPPCNHLIHKNCFDDMLSNGHYACPVCGVSMIPMTEIWKIYDKEIEDTPMPEEYKNLLANVHCKDCSSCNLSPFHVLGIKCMDCGSYNTVREKGSLVRRTNGTLVEEHFEPRLDHDAYGAVAGALPVDGAGSLTPPETPTRDQAINNNALSLGVRRINEPSLLSMTPEPSPVREIFSDPVQDITPSFGAIRRLSFSDESNEASESSSTTHSVETEEEVQSSAQNHASADHETMDFLN